MKKPVRRPIRRLIPSYILNSLKPLTIDLRIESSGVKYSVYSALILYLPASNFLYTISSFSSLPLRKKSAIDTPVHPPCSLSTPKR